MWTPALLLCAFGAAALLWAALAKHPDALGVGILLGASGLVLLGIAWKARRPRT